MTSSRRNIRYKVYQVYMIGCAVATHCVVHKKSALLYFHVPHDFIRCELFIPFSFFAGEKCFKFVFLDNKEGVTWDEAVKLCRDSGRKSDIASIHGPYEHGTLPTQGYLTAPLLTSSPTHFVLLKILNCNIMKSERSPHYWSPMYSPRKRSGNLELRCFIWCWYEQTFE